MLFAHASSAALVPMLFLTQHRKDLFSFLGLKSVLCSSSLPLVFFFTVYDSRSKRASLLFGVSVDQSHVYL